MSYEFNFEIAKETFKKRYAENVGKQVDNGLLPAGAPMYYYCEGCCEHVATLPESWFRSPPPKYCEPCKILKDHGLLKELIKEVKNAKS